MRKPIQLLLPAALMLFLSCKNDEGNTYAIRDYRKSLQPHLARIVNKGIVSHDTVLSNITTDNELIQLSRSEQPIIRSLALREMLSRKTFNHFDVLMNHLSDTARVFTDQGEFGVWYEMVSDNLVDLARWKNQASKDKTIDEVLIKHNYLRSAYIILLKIEPQEKYYSIIKDMATRPRRLTDDGYELAFRDIEFALYGLAAFKKKQDINIIHELMLQHVSELSDMSFRLMKDFPDSSYFDVLQDYHRRRFYRFSGNRRDGFTGFVADKADPEDFIYALVEQKSDESAKLLDTMLIQLPLHTCMPDKDFIRDQVVEQIWEHPCPAYIKLREKIKDRAKELLKRHITLPAGDVYNPPIDTTQEHIWW